MNRYLPDIIVLVLACIALVLINAALYTAGASLTFLAVLFIPIVIVSYVLGLAVFALISIIYFVFFE